MELYRSEPLPDPDWLAQQRLLRQHPALVDQVRAALDRVPHLTGTLTAAEPDQ